MWKDNIQFRVECVVLLSFKLIFVDGPVRNIGKHFRAPETGSTQKEIKYMFKLSSSLPIILIIYIIII